MIYKHGMNASRRSFVKKASTLGVVGAAAPWVLNMAAMAEASAAGATDYKALVCIFLAGGNDQSNTVTPYDTASHNLYYNFRPNFAHSRANLAATALTPLTTHKDSEGVQHDYALSPNLKDNLFPLFNSSKLGIVLNVGTLIEPITKAQYKGKQKPVPPKLFSHNDQASVWQSTMPEGATTGWGGRMGDLFEASGGKSTFTCINVASNAVYMAGNSAMQYQISPSGSASIQGLNYLFGSNAARDVLQKFVTTSNSSHIMENHYTALGKRAIEANATLSEAIKTPITFVHPFPAGGLNDQLKMVARIIDARAKLGVKRQVFFVQMGGFDNHDGMATDHPALLTRLGSSMRAFYEATVQLGVADNVTAFTASDFGRTLSGNANGSDHGWGSMQFVMGGAVNGKQFYGKPPTIRADGPDDIGQGRLLPSTSVEQMAATLGSWMGISNTDLLTILPNLSNYTTRNLGFMKP